LKGTLTMTMLRPFPIPSNDTARSRTVDAMALTDRRDDPFFAHVTAMVRHIFKTPISFISLFSGDHQTFLKTDGLDMQGTPRDMSLCAFTVAAKSTIVLPDTHADPRSRQHPVVTGMGVRFSASAPVITTSGFCLGTVCGLDLAPHDMPSDDQIAMLDTLALMVARFYEQPIVPDPAVAAHLANIAHDAQKEFLALIGHEMRTPLNGIHGMAQVLAPQNTDDAEVIGAILSSAEHLNAVVGSILSFTELSAGEITLEESEVDLDATLHKVLAGFQKMARMQGKNIVVRTGHATVMLRADVAKLELALACLVSNFLHHGGAQCVVTTDHLPDGTVSIGVTDNGAGISPEYQARIWRAFGVGNAVHTRAADGIGLGLPLTRRIVELHGGELDLLREATGMTAMIRLPAWRVLAP
jgi:signal transduction histidine kinase